MNVTIIGTGYVGLVTGACLADSGNNVICVDIDKSKIDLLLSGGVPIYEPGLAELIYRNKEDGRIDFTTDMKRGVEHADIIFIAVGTPMSDSGEANLSYVFEVARDIGKNMNGYKVVVDKSTVPVGTADKVREIISAHTSQDFDVVSNPEFLKEGTAISDFMKPDRVVVGGESKRAIDLMRELYEPFLRTFHPLIVMDTRSAEMTKYAANCFLATKISFINEISNLCEKAGADIVAVREGIGADRRIGYDFLFPGVGYGGSCFPKDVQALIHTGIGMGSEMPLLTAVEEVNRAQKLTLVHKIRAYFGAGRPAEDLSGIIIGLWGLSFKPQTDDMREAPSLVIIEKLLALGAKVQAYDPEAMGEARKILGDTITYAAGMYEALEGADALVLVTEWNEFRRPSWQRIKTLMRGKAIFDGRNIYDPKRAREEGFEYFGMGRKGGHQ
jgi:UDPglucose 6-dehydrogenase